MFDASAQIFSCAKTLVQLDFKSLSVHVRPMSVTGRNVFTPPDENATFFRRKSPRAGAAVYGFILTNCNREPGVRRREQTLRALPRARITFALLLSRDHATHVALQLAACVAA
jgi:hypothetical protein